MNVTRDQLLFLLTAHPDTWVVDTEDAPNWLIVQCLNGGLITRIKDVTFKMTEAGYRELQSRA